MLYYLVRPIARIGLKVFFRKIYFTNTEVIPKDKPVIFAANHPTAFLEPCLLACFQNRPLHFLVRGDFFQHSLARKVLMSLKMIPIYRLKDGGYGKLRENFSTFEWCNELLSRGKVIMILAEGGTEHEKRLRPIRKGTARLVFGALEQYPDLDIYIIPVGVNYTYAERFRSVAMIDFGEPILAQNFIKRYRQHPNQAIKQMTDQLKMSLEERVIIIEKEADESLTEHLFILNRSERHNPIFPIVSKNRLPLQLEKNIADRVNQMAMDQKIKLKNQLEAYFQQLKRLKINDLAIIQQQYAKGIHLLLLLLGFIPFFIGSVGNFLPMAFAHYIKDKYVKEITFQSSVVAAVGLFSWLIYYSILWLIVVKIFSAPVEYVIFLILLPFLGYFSLLYKEFYNKWSKAQKVKQLQKNIFDNLKKLRRQAIGDW